MQEHLSFLERQKKKKKGSQGQTAQSLIEKFFTEWKAKDTDFDFDRFYDTRSTGGRAIIPEQVADYNFVYKGRAGVLEVKQTKKVNRIAVKDFPQLPRMKRRALAGGFIILAIYHTELRKWRFLRPDGWESKQTGGWDLSSYELKNLEELELCISREDI